MTNASITLVFHPGEGTVDTKNKVVTNGAPFGALPKPIRKGYVFDGWYTQPEGGEKITPQDTVDLQEETILYARWIKGSTQKKKSLYRKQRQAIFILIAVVVLLAISVPIVFYFVNQEVYKDADGTKYYAKATDGVYALYYKNGGVVETSPDGYYVLKSGSLVELDTATGKCTEIAVVDVSGTEAIGSGRRVLMYPYISQENVASIEIQNTYGTLHFDNDANLVLQLKGYENQLLVNDQYYIVCASLCNACGYTLSKERLSDPIKDENGHFTEYGLYEETRLDENDEPYTYVPNRFTITDISGNSYTVIVGDLIVSGAGYYAQFEGRDAVYILGTDMEMIEYPIERFVSPAIIYPTSSSNYYNVSNFLLTKNDYSAYNLSGNAEDIVMDPVICFSFIPLESRQNTMDSSASFRIESPNLSKYLADSDNILNVLLKFCLMEFKGVVKFDLSSLNEEDLASYGLLNPAYTITFKQNGLSGSNGSTYSGQNILYISAITEAGSYYVASDVWNMIVEIDSDYLAFLDWTPIKWVDRPFFQVDISYMEKMEFTKGDTTYTIFFDNSASEAAGGSENLRLYVNNGEITDIQNFRQFYKSILQASIEGPADTLTEEEKDAFRQMEDTDPAIQMILRYRATDPAGRTDDRVIRFYRYSQEKSFITIDGQGEFYVLHSYVEKVYNDLLKVLAGEPVDHTSKF